jgi:hypothetical protein
MWGGQSFRDLRVGLCKERRSIHEPSHPPSTLRGRSQVVTTSLTPDGKSFAEDCITEKEGEGGSRTTSIHNTGALTSVPPRRDRSCCWSALAWAGLSLPSAFSLAASGREKLTTPAPASPDAHQQLVHAHRHNSCGDARHLHAIDPTCHCDRMMLRSHPGTHLPPAARGRLHDPLPRPFNELPDRLHASRVAPTVPSPALRRRQLSRRLQPHLRATAEHQHCLQ